MPAQTYWRSNSTTRIDCSHEMENEKPCAITANAIATRRLHLSVAWRVLRPETETNPIGCFNTLHHLALTTLRFHPTCNQRRFLDALIWLSVGGQSSSGLIGTHKTIQLYILTQMLRRWVESSVSVAMLGLVSMDERCIAWLPKIYRRCWLYTWGLAAQWPSG